MTVYVGFAFQPYYPGGGANDLVAVSTDLTKAQAEVEAKLVDDVRLRDAIEERTISIEEQIRQINRGVVTSSGTPTVPIHVEPKPKRVVFGSYGHIIAVSDDGSYRRSELDIIDLGDWEWRWTWSVPG